MKVLVLKLYPLSKLCKARPDKISLRASFTTFYLQICNKEIKTFWWDARVYPKVAYPRREKTRQSAPNEGARRLRQDEQYLTVREILFRARSQMARYHASAAIFTGLGMQHEGKHSSRNRNFLISIQCHTIS
jgi:hypothetical protein